MPSRTSVLDAALILRPDDGEQVAGHLRQTLTAMLSIAAFAGTDRGVQLFDPGNELARVLRDLWQSVPEAYEKAPRTARRSIVTAAHAALAASALFDAVASDLPAGRLTPHQHVVDKVLVDERIAADGAFLADAILGQPIAAPDPALELGLFDRQLRLLYGRQLARLRHRLADLRLLDGHKFWKTLLHEPRHLLEVRNADGRSARVAEALMAVAPEQAVKRYHRYRASLAAAVLEVGFWTGLWGHLDRRVPDGLEPEVLDELRRRAAAGSARTGLSALRAALGPAGDEPVDRYWATLRGVYRKEFDRPLVDEHEQTMPAGWSSPTLSAAYVNPSFRAVEFAADMRPSEQRWWAEHVQLRGDLVRYLADLVTDARWTNAPILVLGDPGAGKSVLTSALAAVLSEVGYRVVRVDLRSVTATRPIVDQIQEALQATLGRAVLWADLADAARPAPAMVIFDGFDELLQTSEVNQSSYLEDVWRFQQHESALGRPLLTVVTSRTLVAHRARIPRGSAVLRIEPFGTQEIKSWLATWNAAAEQHNRARRLNPLTAYLVLRFRRLARQPLLLLMLAIYDLAGNDLQRHPEALGNAGLYELLLTEFTRRQVRKKHAKAGDARIADAVAVELDGLSIAALAMLNRGQLWISQQQLDADLESLTGPRPPATAGDTFEERLTAAELLVDRFFFIHDTRKRVGEQTVHRYEFMHSTFGEYLIARLVANTLVELLRSAEGQPRVLSFAVGAAAGLGNINDGVLAALLSYELLSAREEILPFAVRRIELLDEGHRRRLFGLIAALLDRRIARHDAPALEGYAPRAADGLVRIATYTANLALLLVSASPGGLPLERLVAGPEPRLRWQRLTRVWYAGLDRAAWNALIRTITIAPDGRGRWTVARSDGVDPYPRAGITEAYLTARMLAHGETRRLLGAVDAVARRRDAWFGHDGAPISALLGLALPGRSPSAVEPALFAAAFDAAAQLEGADRGDYLTVVARGIEHAELPSAGDRLALLWRAVEEAGRGAAAPALLATVIRQARWLAADDVVRAAAARLSDLDQIRDPRALLEALLTLAELTSAGERLIGVSSFDKHLARVPLDLLTDPATWPRVVCAVCGMRPRLWLHLLGRALLKDLDARLVALIEPEQMEALTTMAFEADEEQWLGRFRQRWAAVRAQDGGQ